MHVNGVTFDGLHSYYDLGEMWLSERPKLDSPKPKTNLVEIPGADGVLDMTEANSGEVRFNNRPMEFVFVAMVPIDRQEEFKARIRTALHGKRINRIILDEDSEWFYSGRATVEFSDAASWRIKITVKVDADPYARRASETVFEKALYDDDFMVLSDKPFAVDVSKQYWNTDLRFGTELFPLDFSGYSKIIVKWPQNPYVWNLSYATINISDSDGGAMSVNIPLSNHAPTSDSAEITILDMVDDGVDPSKIYRVLVSGIGGCVVTGQTERSAFLKIPNSRMTVVPRWNVTANGNVNVYLNGTKFSIQNFDGYSTPDIQLTDGENSLIIPYSQTNRPSKVVVTFTEGKL